MAITFLTNEDKQELLKLIQDADGGCITGSGAPTTATEGDVGSFYMDTLTGAVYKCTAANEGSYTWVSLSVGDLTEINNSINQLSKAIGELGSAVSVINVKDYGAMGDGVTDDQSAIQAAVNAAVEQGGGTVYLPRGRYVLKSYIAWESNVSLIGDGVGQSILLPTSDEAVLGFSAIEYDRDKYGTNSPITNCAFREFEIDGSGLSVSAVSPRGKGIFLIGVKDCIFENILIRETCATGLGIDALVSVLIDKVTCINCGRTWVPQTSEQNIGCAGIGIGTNMIAGECFTISNCIVRGCGNMGIFLEDQTLAYPMREQSAIITGCIVENGKNVGIGVRGVKNLLVTGNISRNNKHGVEFSRKNENIVVEGNQIYENEYGVFDNSVSLDGIDIVNNKIEKNTTAGIRYTNTTTLGTGIKQNVLLKNNHIRNDVTGAWFTGNNQDLSIIDNLFDGNTVGVRVDTGTALEDAYVMQNIFKKNASDYEGIFESLSGEYCTDLVAAELVGISMSDDTVLLGVGRTKRLYAKPIPINAVLGAVTWKSSNDGIATVTDGVITAVGVGNCIITANHGEFSAECSVEVIEAGTETEPYTITITESDVQDGYYSDAGEYIEDSKHETCIDYIPVENIVGCKINKHIGIIFFDAEKNMVSRSMARNSVYFVIPSGVKYLKVKIAKVDGNLVNETLTIYPTNSNIFTATSLSEVYVSSAGVDTASPDIVTTQQKIPVNGGETYYIGVDVDTIPTSMNNIRVAEYSEDETFITRNLNIVPPIDYVTSENCRFIRISYTNKAANRQFTEEEKKALLESTYIY